MKRASWACGLQPIPLLESRSISASHEPSMFAELLERLARTLEQAHLPYMVIGGQAVLLYGEPRLTRDIDITPGVDVDRQADVNGAATSLGITPWSIPSPSLETRWYCPAWIRPPVSGSISSFRSLRMSVRLSIEPPTS